MSYGDGFSNVPRPVFGHGLVYIATGFQTPSLMPFDPTVRATSRARCRLDDQPWRTLHALALLVGSDLYFVSDTGVLTVADAVSGKVVWQQRLGGNYSASPVSADGRIYFQSEEGVTTVIAPGREFRKLAVNQLDGAMLASIAVSNGSLFIRTHTHLYRIAEKK